VQGNNLAAMRPIAYLAGTVVSQRAEMNALVFLIEFVLNVTYWLVLIYVIVSLLVTFNVINLNNDIVRQIYYESMVWWSHCWRRYAGYYRRCRDWTFRRLFSS